MYSIGQKAVFKFGMTYVRETLCFFDATGNVVRRSVTGTDFLYYELSFRNPVKGKSPIPVAAMITEKQTTPCISHFLEEFRAAESKCYGHDKLSQPVQINVDWSMAIIKAFCNVINNETYRDFMSRSWRIVNGTANSAELKKSVIHVCLSHFMHCLKVK